jgi:hypothetical protein
LKIVFAAVFNPASTNYSQAIALEQLGHEVHRYEYRLKAQELGSDYERDRDFESFIHTVRPDLTIFSKCNEMSVSTVWAAKKYGRAALWYMDPIESGVHPSLKKKCLVADAVFCGIWDSFVELSKLNRDTHFLHEGYDHIQNFPVQAEKKFDVSFIGDLRGHRFDYYAAYPFTVINNAYGERHSLAVSMSKINLNFTHGGCSDRVYKVLASRGFLLTELWPKMENDFIFGTHLDFFTTPSEMVEKIKFYLDNPQKMDIIAHEGYRCVQKFSRLNWAKILVEKCKK